MAEALEERATMEVVVRVVTKNEALERDNKLLVVEKNHLCKLLDASKAAEGVALEKAKKAYGIAENLRNNVDVEKLSSDALHAEVERLKKQLEEAKTLGMAAAEAYTASLNEFGGVILWPWMPPPTISSPG